MIKAVLFDLDDTLLDLNLTAFVARYAKDKTRVLTQISGLPSARVGMAVGLGFLQMDARDLPRNDGLTNQERFDRLVEARTGIPLHDPAIADALECLDRTVVPTYRDGLVMARPRPGVREALDAVGDLGLVAALATNPVFSLECDEARMAWAGLAPDDFALVSTADNSHDVKPNARYYQEFIGQLGLRPEECLMVGNDTTRDFPQPDIGLRTAYVGHAWARRAVFRGDLVTFARKLPGIVAYLNALDE